MRLCDAYERLDPEKGWKSFTYNHCRGAMLDYLKFGKGYKENKWIPKDKEGKPNEQPRLTQRIQNFDHKENRSVDLDQALGLNNVFDEMDPDTIKIKWELLARMASVDENLHAFAKLLLGHTIEDMAPVFGLCRTRVSQMIQAFVDRFDDGIKLVAAAKPMLPMSMA